MRPRCAFAVTLAVALSCGGRSPRPGPPRDGPLIRHYTPLAFKIDANEARRAVILGTDDTDGSTVIALPGQYSNLVIGATPDAWSAVISAADALGKDVSDLSLAPVTTRAAAAGASAMLTANVLATLTANPIDESAAIEGTVLPDGTIGPIAGLPDRIRAAISRGKRRLAVPVGLRGLRAPGTADAGDIDALARAHGAELVEVADVGAAFRHLTGERLPETVPVREADMQLAASTLAVLDARYLAWRRRLAGEWSSLLEIEQSGRLAPALAALVRRARQHGEAAELLYRRGHVAAAYQRVVEGWRDAAAATRTYRALGKLRGRDVGAALLQLGTTDELHAETVAAFDAIGAVELATLADHVRVLAASQSALRGRSYERFASDALVEARAAVGALNIGELTGPGAVDAVAARITTASLLLASGMSSARVAREELELVAEGSVPYAGSLEDIATVSDTLRTAATGDGSDVGPSVIPAITTQPGASDIEARGVLAASEPGLGAAFALHPSALPVELRDAEGEASMTWRLVTLAAAQLAYRGTSHRLAYVSLGVELDATTARVRGLSHPGALGALLDASERRARAQARAARIATGEIPIPAKLAYAQARVAATGDVAAQIGALAGYWLATSYAQAAVMLARN